MKKDWKTASEYWLTGEVILMALEKHWVQTMASRRAIWKRWARMTDYLKD